MVLKIMKTHSSNAIFVIKGLELELELEKVKTISQSALRSHTVLTLGEPQNLNDVDIYYLKIKIEATSSRELIDLLQKMEKLTKIVEDILDQKIWENCSDTNDQISTMKGKMKNIKAEHEIHH